MKKILSILLTVILSLCCFAACGDDPFLNGGGSTGGSMSSDTGSSDTGGSSGGDAVVTYTITYVLTDGIGTMEGESVQEVKVGEAFTLNKLSRDEDYTGYWTYEGKEFKSGIWTLEENITLYSKWSSNWTGTY